MANTFAVRQFLSYFAKARTVYNTHSPFLYELTRQVLEDDRHYYAFDELEALRQKLLHVETEIDFVDFGAGSHDLGKKNTRKIKDIARTSLISPFKAKWMFRLVNFVKPKTILEIGTSLGVSTLYLQSAALHAHVVTLEGNPGSVQFARKNFSIFPYGATIELVEGRFEKTLPGALQKLQKLDFVFMDGNHQEAPTLDYFELMRPFLSENSVVVLDDIYWSPGMAAAWKQLRDDAQVSLSVDLYHFGILFFRKENKEKEHHILAPSKWKPWVRAW
jgi:predicted O-methyltransferase YrrM